LSATAIEDYQNCPLKFKFSHFLKIPTGPAPALTFGSVMHQCVRRYFELRVKKVPDFAEIEKFYQERWKSAGFEDSFQEETYKRAGLDQLRKYVDEQNARPVDASAIRHEQHFSLDLGDAVLEGRIDQINPLSQSATGGDPARSRVELVDYKTGKPRSQKDADKSLQLSVYALAAKQHLGLEPERLTFYNLTSNQPVSSVRTASDLQEVKDTVRVVAQEIRAGNFPATPGFVCKFCGFIAICPAHEEEF
jgi:RecB family exonuclease